VVRAIECEVIMSEVIVAGIYRASADEVAFMPMKVLPAAAFNWLNGDIPNQAVIHGTVNSDGIKLSFVFHHISEIAHPQLAKMTATAMQLCVDCIGVSPNPPIPSIDSATIMASRADGMPVSLTQVQFQELKQTFRVAAVISCCLR
jgi:hypothetical protein